MGLLSYCETCWLSHAKVLHGIFALKDGITVLLCDNNNTDNANLSYNEDLIQKLAYLIDILKE
jgi:hypothetical protein